MKNTKKLVYLSGVMLVVVLIAGFFAPNLTFASIQSPVFGDLDGDNKVTAVDVQLVINASLGRVPNNGPTITLLGAEHMNPRMTIDGNQYAAVQIVVINSGPYPEDGATAVDIEGNDLSAIIKMDSNVDMTQAGMYIVAYKVADGVGRITTAQKAVFVVDATVIFSAMPPKGESGPVAGQVVRSTVNPLLDGMVLDCRGVQMALYITVPDCANPDLVTWVWGPKPSGDNPFAPVDELTGVFTADIFTSLSTDGPGCDEQAIAVTALLEPGGMTPADLPVCLPCAIDGLAASAIAAVQVSR